MAASQAYSSTIVSPWWVRSLGTRLATGGVAAVSVLTPHHVTGPLPGERAPPAGRTKRRERSDQSDCGLQGGTKRANNPSEARQRR
ncbi:hypothetical protein Pa4123_02540 [Phytohabitans aurantiacus]|uniref:Secreted protein n=1 Tax=Phytohabitans aurantiacus TaxID=3016789 RepID=A0ABQ5QLC0_9ACTN|nr:hypothetical protein Pa4123_02540 [Phytohabitans aurantiacus]